MKGIQSTIEITFRFMKQLRNISNQTVVFWRQNSHNGIQIRLARRAHETRHNETNHRKQKDKHKYQNHTKTNPTKCIKMIKKT